MLTLKKKQKSRKRAKQGWTGRKVLVRILLSLMLVFCMSYGMSIFFEQETQIERLLDKREELQAQYDKTAAKKAEIEYLLEKSGSLEYIEKIAREELGMVKPGDVLFTD